MVCISICDPAASQIDFVFFFLFRESSHVWFQKTIILLTFLGKPKGQ